MQATLVGIQKGQTKNGTDFTILSVVCEFNDFDLSRGATGQDAMQVYVNKKLNFKLGSVIDVVYGVGYQGKAVVNNVLLLSND